MSEAKLCYWCHEPLPPLPEDASYVDEINHYIHDECRDERDDQNRRRDELLTGIAGGTIDSIPDIVRSDVLGRIKRLGFARRCPCLYDEAYGFAVTSQTTSAPTMPTTPWTCAISAVAPAPTTRCRSSSS